MNITLSRKTMGALGACRLRIDPIFAGNLIKTNTIVITSSIENKNKLLKLYPKLNIKTVRELNSESTLKKIL